MFDFYFSLKGGYFFGYQSGRYSYNEKESSVRQQRNACITLGNGFQTKMCKVLKGIYGPAQ